MGSLFGSKPKVPAKSDYEIRLEREAAQRLADDEKRAAEEEAQRKRNMRGRRSLFSDENEGRGFPGPTVP